jgi:hypothetical protein
VIIDFMEEDVYDRIQELTKRPRRRRLHRRRGHRTRTMSGFDAVIDRVKVATFMGTDRPHVLRQAIHCCRNFGTVSIVGVYGGFLDKIPMGSAINKASPSAWRRRPCSTICRLLERIEKRRDRSVLRHHAHRATLEEGPELYKTFRDKKDGCIKVVMKPPLGDCLELGGPDDYLAQPDFSGGAWRFLAVQLGGIEEIVEALRQHLLRTGRGQDPHQSARFGTALAGAEAARLWTRQACLLVELGEADLDHVVSYVDLARGAVERAALDVMELANRSVGLQAFIASHPVERLVRDLATYLRQPAPDRALVAGAAAGLSFDEPVGDMWP